MNLDFENGMKTISHVPRPSYVLEIKAGTSVNGGMALFMAYPCCIEAPVLGICQLVALSRSCRGRL